MKLIIDVKYIKTLDYESKIMLIDFVEFYRERGYAEHKKSKLKIIQNHINELCVNKHFEYCFCTSSDIDKSSSIFYNILKNIEL